MQPLKKKLKSWGGVGNLSPGLYRDVLCSVCRHRSRAHGRAQVFLLLEHLRGFHENTVECVDCATNTEMIAGLCKRGFSRSGLQLNTVFKK